MARVLISVPPRARRGDIIEIKTLISHPMESGYRVGTNGSLIPRDIIGLFTCAYNGEEIFANPFLSFFMMATESATITFRWTGDNRFEATETAAITVE